MAEGVCDQDYYYSNQRVVKIGRGTLKTIDTRLAFLFSENKQLFRGYLYYK